MKILMWVCLALCTTFPVSGSDDEGSPNGSGFTNPSFGACSPNNLRDPFHVGAPPKGSFSSQTKYSTPDASTAALLARHGVKEALSNRFIVEVLSIPEAVALLLKPEVIALLSDENKRNALLKTVQESEKSTESMLWGME